MSKKHAFHPAKTTTQQRTVSQVKNIKMNPARKPKPGFSLQQSYQSKFLLVALTFLLIWQSEASACGVPSSGNKVITSTCTLPSTVAVTNSNNLVVTGNVNQKPTISASAKRLFDVSGGMLRLQGLQVIGGRTSGGSTNGFPSYSDDGGQIRVKGSGTQLVLEDCEFDGESSSYWNGGTLMSVQNGACLIVAESASVQIERTTFTNFRAKQSGGAIILTSSVTATMSHVTFRLNLVYHNSGDHKVVRGGALFVTDQTHVSISDSTFDRNLARMYGGAINVENSWINITRTLFECNRASTTSKLQSSHTCDIMKNFQAEGSGHTGGISLGDSSTMISKDSTFTNNKGHSGGAITVLGDSLVYMSGSNRFQDNTAGTGASIRTVTVNTVIYETCPESRYSPMPTQSVEDDFVGCPALCPVQTFANGTAQRTSIHDCTPCLRGHKCDTQGLAQPIPCQSGEYQPDEDKTFCIPCNQGTFAAEEGSTACMSCPLGKYANGIGSSECTSCDRGKTTFSEGAATCVDCPVGKVASRDFSCQSCEVGKWHNERNKMCSACAMGKEATHEGAMGCYCCSAGTFKASESTERCTDCAAGFYREASTGLFCSDAAACSSCPAGYYQSNTGQTMCLGCMPGQYQGEENATQCHDCAVGMFSSALNASQCNACPAAKTPGLSSCPSCKAGEFGANCRSCPSGWYKFSTEFSESCTACPAGFHQKDNGTSFCLPCAPGEFSPQIGRVACDLCAVGKFSKDPEAVACKDCAQGREGKETGLAFCLPCNAGTYESDLDTCIKCPQGWSQAAPGANTCIACPIGKSTKGEVGSLNCRLCQLGEFGQRKFGSTISTCAESPAGHYNDGKGQQAPNGCPTDTYRTTTGGTSLRQCTTCSKGRTTSGRNGSATQEACVCRGQDVDANNNPRRGYYSEEASNECKDCPSGGICPVDGSTVEQLRADVGYWRANNKTTVFVSCKAAFRGINEVRIAKATCCPAGSSLCNGTKFLATSAPWSDHQCAHPHVGPLCAMCAADFVRIGDTCETCLGGPQILAAFIVVSVLAFICFAITLAVQLRSNETKKRKHNKFRGPFKIIIGWFQILSSLRGSADSVPWPASFQYFSVVAGVFNLDLFELLGGNPCQVELPFMDKFLVHMTIPVAIVGAVWLANGVAAIKGGDHRQRLFRHMRVGKITLVTLLLLYPGLATRIFTMFRSVDIAGVGPVLAADFSVEFHGARHTEMMILAVAAMVVYVAGIPLLILILLVRKKKHLYNDDDDGMKHEEAQYQLGAVYMQYENKFFWWEVVVILQKMLMTGALVIVAPGSPVQILTASMFMLAYMLLVLRASPYVSDIDDDLVAASSVSVFLVTLCGFIIVMDNSETPTFSASLIEMLITANIACTGVFIATRIVLLVRGKGDQHLVIEDVQSKMVDVKSTKVYPSSQKVAPPVVPPPLDVKEENKDDDDHASRRASRRRSRHFGAGGKQSSHL